MRQALFKCEMPHLELKSSRSFLAIKCFQRTKSKKVINPSWSSLKSWAHTCAHRGKAVKGKKGFDYNIVFLVDELRFESLINADSSVELP